MQGKLDRTRNRELLLKACTAERPLRVFAVTGTLLAGLLLVGAVACSDKSHRMGEAETLQYKRALIEAHKEELSPKYAERLMYYPGRTRGEIDSYLDELKQEHAEEVAAARAEWEARREYGEDLEEEMNSEEGSGPAGSSGGSDEETGGGVDGGQGGV
jgi:hypothetical protein